MKTEDVSLIESESNELTQSLAKSKIFWPTVLIMAVPLFLLIIFAAFSPEPDSSTIDEMALMIFIMISLLWIFGTIALVWIIREFKNLRHKLDRILEKLEN